MSAKYPEDIAHRRAENDARIIYENQRPHGNSYRGTASEPVSSMAQKGYYRQSSDEAINITSADKIALKMAVGRWQHEHGEQPFPIIDKHRPRFHEFMRLSPTEVLHWTEDQIFELCAEWPIAASLLIIDMRDELIRAVQEAHGPMTIDELRRKVLEACRG
jgi:hypothetical protein